MHYILLFRLFIEGLVYSGNKPVIVFFLLLWFHFFKNWFWNLEPAPFHYLFKTVCVAFGAQVLDKTEADGCQHCDKAHLPKMNMATSMGTNLSWS